MTERVWQRAKQEAQIHLSMDHPHIVRLHRVYDEGSAMHFVMERLEGGELFDRLYERRRFSEKDASDVARQVLSALAYMHAQGVVHRDLKLENIMYATKDSQHVKLIDLGFAIHLHGEQKMQESCGSLQYMAPEILKRRYSEKVDVWSMGSIVYTLLVGEPLFKGTDREVLRKTAAGKPDFSRRLHLLSRGARNFIVSLLALNPTKRLSASEALTHAWLFGLCSHGGCCSHRGCYGCSRCPPHPSATPARVLALATAPTHKAVGIGGLVTASQGRGWAPLLFQCALGCDVWYDYAR